MSEDDVKQFMKQHIDNYRNAIIDIIHNNTNVLVDEDITSLLKTPPLDSMDVLKTKLLSFAKSNRIVFNTESLNKILESYRKDILKCCPKIKKTREEPLKNKVTKAKLSLNFFNTTIQITVTTAKINIPTILFDRPLFLFTIFPLSRFLIF